ncbi:CHC2 zinc finger domain-containing protein [Mucilaginibacter sp.]
MSTSNSNSSPIFQEESFIDIVSKYVSLNESRNILKGNCPFHRDSTNSFMISPAKNIFKCFGCGQEGGVIEFIMLIENKSVEESIALLKNQFGLKIS